MDMCAGDKQVLSRAPHEDKPKQVTPENERESDNDTNKHNTSKRTLR
jgi:hypothetical protein